MTTAPEQLNQKRDVSVGLPFAQHDGKESWGEMTRKMIPKERILASISNFTLPWATFSNSHPLHWRQLAWLVKTAPTPTEVPAMGSWRGRHQFLGVDEWCFFAVSGTKHKIIPSKKIIQRDPFTLQHVRTSRGQLASPGYPFYRANGRCSRRVAVFQDSPEFPAKDRWMLQPAFPNLKA